MSPTTPPYYFITICTYLFVGSLQANYQIYTVGWGIGIIIWGVQATGLVECFCVGLADLQQGARAGSASTADPSYAMSEGSWLDFWFVSFDVFGSQNPLFYQPLAEPHQVLCFCTPNNFFRFLLGVQVQWLDGIAR